MYRRGEGYFWGIGGTGNKCVAVDTGYVTQAQMPRSSLCVGRTSKDVSSAPSFLPRPAVRIFRLVQVMEALLMTVKVVSTHSCQLSQLRSASVPFLNSCE